MRLVVKQSNRTISELQFDKGPVYIGRSSKNQVTLPDQAVSRQHAVISSAGDGKWTLEDLDSANKTYLNDEPIHKAEIKTGDSIRIRDFTIEINLEDDAATEQATALEAAAPAEPVHGPQIIIRDLTSQQAPPIRFPAAREKDFVQATEAISKADGLDEILQSLVSIIAKQFNTSHTWCALRSEPAGPMTAHAGKAKDGSSLDLSEIKLSDKINQAVERSQFLLFLFSQDITQPRKGQLRSAVIAPIIGQAGCFGVLYTDNIVGDEHYSLSDLDYLMLLGNHTVTALTNP